MGKKGSWFAAVKRAWVSDSKKKDKEAQSRGDNKEKKENLDSEDAETALRNPVPLIPLPETVASMAADDDDEQSRHAYSVAFATAVAAEAAVAAAQAAAEVVRLTSAARSSRKSKEEMAAVKIQSTFRGYMARRALQGVRGLVRLKSMIHERSVQQKAITTLKCMQKIAKLQSEVRASRIRMSEENRALQKQLQQKREKELEKPKIPLPGDKFDVSTHTKEQIKAKLESRQEAAKRRERALTYAYTHQMTRRNSLKPTNQTFMDPYNPQWGWSWLERWMGSRPWDNRVAVIKELSSNDTATVKTTPKVNARISSKEISNDPLPVKTTQKVNDSKRSATPLKQNCPPAGRQSPVNAARTLPAAGRLPQLSSKGSHENDAASTMTAAGRLPMLLSLKGSHENDADSTMPAAGRLPMLLTLKGSHENDAASTMPVAGRLLPMQLSLKGSHENDAASTMPAAGRLLPMQLSLKESHENDEDSTMPVAGRLPTQLSAKGSHENDDPRSKTSEPSEQSRRHSSAEAVVSDYVNIASPQGSRNPSFMAPTVSTKARSRTAARPLLYLEKRYETAENAKEKMSSNGAPRRHSAPPAMI